MKCMGQVQQANFTGQAVLFRLFHRPRAAVGTSAHRDAIVVGFAVPTEVR